MIYTATHITRYTYQGPVSQSLSEARLMPRTFPGQKLHSFRLQVVPEPANLEHRQDYFGNDVNSFAVFRTHDHFSATATSIVEVTAPAAALSPTRPSIRWEDARDQLAQYSFAPTNSPEPSSAQPAWETQRTGDNLGAYEFVFDSPFASAAPELAEFARPTFTPGRPLVEAVNELSSRIHSEFRYKPKSTSIDIPLLEVLEKRQGVCQDFAHIMIGSLRSLRLAARYVSGYLRSGVGAEASHAWASVFVPGTGPGTGWLSFDPTNNVIPGEGHVTLGWGRDFGDVTPIKGIALGGGEQTIEVEVRVEPLAAV